MSDGATLEAVLDAVTERVVPTPAERDRLQSAVTALRERTADVVGAREYDTDVTLVGSTARDTWLREDRDIDIFVRFPPDLDRSTLESEGLAIGHEVLPDGREAFAEHPYVTGTYDGFDVDLVPCFDVESASETRSAVDRSPFHTAYVREQLDSESTTAVRLTKQLLKGIGAYGSDLKTEGFSGYLVELLVLEYGDVRSLLEAASAWSPPVRLDPENHGKSEFEDPLVVVDPTDPHRNVAAVVSADHVARLQHYARSLLADPRESVFTSSLPEAVSEAAVRAHLERRETQPLAIRFDAPDIVDDQLYPQLRRSLRGLVTGLETHGFRVLRATTFAADDAVLFLECSVASLPAVERHVGPPVALEDHASGFYETYADADCDGPFIEDGRYVVERERSIQTARAFAEQRFLEGSVGADVEVVVETSGYDVLAGSEVLELVTCFGTELGAYFDPTP